jgi:hypothetical protein
LKGGLVPIDITQIFASYLARNSSPDPTNPERRQTAEYGVAASLDGNVIDLALTFHRGAAYCCYEHGCHLALDSGKRWEWLRRALATQGIETAPRLELRLTVVIEGGALFFDLLKPDPIRQGWYAFTPAEARQYQVHILEAPPPEADERAERVEA